MPVSKKRITRKTRDFTKVIFEVPEYFEGTFEVPDFNRLNVEELSRLNNNDIKAIADLFDRTGCEAEAEIARELEMDEIQPFMDAWQKASGVDLPKSKG